MCSNALQIFGGASLKKKIKIKRKQSITGFYFQMRIAIPAAVHRIITRDIVSTFSSFGQCDIKISSDEETPAVFVHPHYLVKPNYNYKVVESTTSSFEFPATMGGCSVTRNSFVVAEGDELVNGKNAVTFDVMASPTVEPATEVSSVSPDAFIYDVMRTFNETILFSGPHVERIHSCLESGLKDGFGPTFSPSNFSAGISSSLVRYIEEAFKLYLKHPEVRAGQTSPECNMKWIAWISPFSFTSCGSSADSFPPQPLQRGLKVQFFIFYVHSSYPPSDWYQTGARLALLYEAARQHPSLKIVQANLLLRATLVREAVQAYDTLLVNPSSLDYAIPEGSKSNYLLLTDDNRFLCSSTEDILLGVTLQTVKDVIRKAGLGEVTHQKLYFKDLLLAKSLVCLGTSPGVLPIKEVVLYRKDCEEERAQCEAIAAAGSLNLASYTKVIEIEKENTVHFAAETLEIDEVKVVTPKENVQLVIIAKEVHNDCIDRLLAAYQQVALSAYRSS